jgi:hypothetical protein
LGKYSKDLNKKPQTPPKPRSASLKEGKSTSLVRAQANRNQRRIQRMEDGGEVRLGSVLISAPFCRHNNKAASSPEFGEVWRPYSGTFASLSLGEQRK